MVPVMPALAKSPEGDPEVFTGVDLRIVRAVAIFVGNAVYGPSGVKYTSISQASSNQKSEKEAFIPEIIRNELKVISGIGLNNVQQGRRSTRKGSTKGQASFGTLPQGR